MGNPASARTGMIQHGRRKRAGRAIDPASSCHPVPARRPSEPEDKALEGLETLGGKLPAPSRFVALLGALAGLETVSKAEVRMSKQRPVSTPPPPSRSGHRHGNRPGRWRQSASRPSRNGGLKNLKNPFPSTWRRDRPGGEAYIF
jgi:hypothetical protein